MTKWRTSLYSAVAITMSAAAPVSAQTLRAIPGSVAAPARIQQIVGCNPSNERSLLTVYQARALDDAVAEHHRLVPIRNVERVGPLEDSPAPQRPPATEVVAAGGVEVLSSVPIAAVEGLTSVVGEPTAAARGREVIYTGNWYAAFSTDSGTTFSCVDPFRTFPDSPNGQSFCCDQVVVYAPRQDMLVWLLQYSRRTPVGASAENIFRLAVAVGSDISTQQWRHYELKPSELGGSSGEWFDYPDLAVGSQFLYLTSNAFQTGGAGAFVRSMAVRIPLQQLHDYSPLTVEHVTPPNAGTLKLARGATDTMYFGTHVRSGAAQFVRVYSWPENAATIGSDDILVQRWVTDTPSVAPGPDGNDWLGRSDGRITAAWLAGDRLGFAWNAPQGGTFLYPHVRALLLNRSDKAVIAQPHIWNAGHAFAYAAAAPNGAGDVGLSIAYGGNTLHPSHSVGALLNNQGTWQWTLRAVSAGTNGPGGADEAKWGDYLSVQPHGADQATWVASGFTLQGGSTGRQVQPRYVSFRLTTSPSPTDEPAARLVRESRRLEATWEQQPANGAAIRKAMQRLQAAIEAAGTGGVQPTVPAALVRPTPPQNVDDTHRPTPGDSQAPVVSLTGTQLKAFIASASATLKQLQQSINGARRDMAAEKRAVDALGQNLRGVR